jgi:hypothetical protein
MKKNGDPLPFLDAHLQKKVAELVGSMIHLLAGERTILKVDHLLLRLKEAPFLYPVTDIDHDYNPLLSD